MLVLGVVHERPHGALERLGTADVWVFGGFRQHARGEPDGGIGVLAHAKCNVAPLGPSLNYELNQAKGLVWTGISPLSADDLNAGPEVKSALDDAREFLQELLSKGRMAANDVIAEAERAGVSERTLKRAKNGLARSVLEDGHWWWKLLPPPGVESEPAHPGANAEYADILKRSWDDIPVPKLLRARNAS